MKTIKSISTIIAIFTVLVLNAQTFQGKAFYQTKRNFELKMDSTKTDNAQQKMIQEMLRKQFEKNYILTFSKTASIYKEVEKLAKPNPSAGSFSIEIIGDKSTLYKNIKDRVYADSREDYGKKFLVSDALENYDWKIEKETKNIGKYLCIKATTSKFIDDYDEDHNKKEALKEIKITAWYTPEIPVSNGPEMFQGLPGLILELHEGKMHYVCNKIVLNPSEKIAIIAPKKGKKINKKDYDELIEKKNKEMMEQFKSTRKKGDKGDSFTIKIGN